MTIICGAPDIICPIFSNIPLKVLEVIWAVVTSDWSMISVISPANPHEADEHRDLHQGADDRGEGLAGIEAEDGHRHGNGQFEIIAGRSEGQRGGDAVIRARLGRHEEGEKKHHQEIDDQGDGDAHHIQGELHDVFALQGEHDDNGKQQSDESDGTDLGHEFFFIPLDPLAPDQKEAGEHAAEKGDAQVDHYAFRHLEDGNLHLQAGGDP
jgi:hypothetical protein